MKNTLLLFLFLVAGLSAFAQIDRENESVQVISYWEKGDKQNYYITLEKLKIIDNDTISRELVSYDVEVSVLGATEDSYSIQWHYKNFETSNPNPLLKKIAEIPNDMKVVFKTDELGTFIELENWEEIRDFNLKMITELKDMFKDTPEVGNILNQVYASYLSKESIQATATKDIQQYHTFHGAAYSLGEVLEGNILSPNAFGGKPFDTEVLVYLDEIDEEEDNYIMRASYEVNKEQLVEAVLNFAKELSKEGEIPLPTTEELEDLSNETHVGSRIHDSGWLIYSFQTTTVISEEEINIEERIIELK